MKPASRVLTSLAKLVQPALSRAGYRLVPLVATNPALLPRFFHILKRQGFSPRHVIDVGANQGDWTRLAVDYFPDATFLLIEPQAELRARVQDLIDRGHKIEWLTAGASDKSGILEFTINPRADSSTFALSRAQAESLGFSRVMVEVLTLNDVIRSRGMPPPEMIKIDAEGFDLKVLAGASDILGITDIILMEVGIVARGIENTAAAVINTMAAAGYRLIDITDVNRSPRDDVLWLCEFAFLRNGSSLLDAVTTYE